MSRDLRAYSRQTQIRLLVGFILLVFLIGDGLIYWIYGRAAAITGLICLLAGLAPLLLIWGALSLLAVISRRIEDA